MPLLSIGLSSRSLGYFNYLNQALAQPPGSWQGFYDPQSPSMNFALRYQLAFASYAVAAMSQRTPAYRTPYVEALQGGLEKMLDVAAWGYWRGVEASQGNLAGTGHVAVLLAPHQQTASGPPSDPIAQDNLQYSGHLSTMLGLYEKVSGDHTYDQPFTLHDPQSGVSYTYTHSQVAGRIYAQMRENPFGGVCCERGMAYVPCNNYSLASNILHDRLHGTRFSRANGRWLKTVRDKMALRGPAVRGVFGATYMTDLHMAAPVAFNFTDAWGLAFLLPFSRPLVRKMYGRFKKKIAREEGGAYVDSSPLSERLEISDVPLNTGFGLILAKGVGDEKQASALLSYAAGRFDAGWLGSRYFFRGAPRTLHSTALYALAECMEPGGEGFSRLFNGPIDHAAGPTLETVEEPIGRVGVFQAEYDADRRTLHIGLRQVGDSAELRGASPSQVALTLGNITAPALVEVNGVSLGMAGYTGGEDDSLRFEVSVPPVGDVYCRIRLEGRGS